MRISQTTEVTAGAPNNEWNEELSVSSANTAYYEMSENPMMSVDPLLQMQKNIQSIAELQSKFSFVMREVKYLLKA